MKKVETRKKTIQPRAAQEITQGITVINHTVGHFLEFVYAEGDEDADGKFIPDVETTRTCMIKGAAYASLMSEKPSWSPKKPAGMYREADLFALMDAMRESPEQFAGPAVDSTLTPQEVAQGKKTLSRGG